MKTFTFTNKETYLVYRSEWKANYKTLSQKIRTLKAEIRDTQREGGLAGGLQYGLIKERAKAKSMLEELVVAKELAQVQYLAAHSKQLVPV
jgi:hypothetical protein